MPHQLRGHLASICCISREADHKIAYKNIQHANTHKHKQDRGQRTPPRTRRRPTGHHGSDGSRPNRPSREGTQVKDRGAHLGLPVPVPGQLAACLCLPVPAAASLPGPIPGPLLPGFCSPACLCCLQGLHPCWVAPARNRADIVPSHAPRSSVRGGLLRATPMPAPAPVCLRLQ